jgi:hypothetical protein
VPGWRGARRGCCDGNAVSALAVTVDAMTEEATMQDEHTSDSDAIANTATVESGHDPAMQTCGVAVKNPVKGDRLGWTICANLSEHDAGTTIQVRHGDGTVQMGRYFCAEHRNHEIVEK